eukprot:TRINITY_DN5636_c0_g2_i2.p1 TRINITY_DN5636_c0_g2~~TRINITY_DN5636_c0_g2_i2.p1  ORF type:complete len:420 (-),score=67.25 TRINITY_DN5636_c0_g2_i2:30-1289(-)
MSSSFVRKGTIVARPTTSSPISTTSISTPTTSTTTTQLSSNTSSPVILATATRGSVHNRQILVSSGFADLDEIIGGGFALGTVVLVCEDRFSQHFSMLLRYVAAEGIASQHTVILCSPEKIALETFVKKLPHNSTLDRSSASEPTGQAPIQDPKLKIAWQYQKYIASDNPKASQVAAPTSQKPTSSAPKKSIGPVYCHSHDFSKQIQPYLLEQTPPLLVHSQDSNPTTQSTFQDIYTQIKNQLASFRGTTKAIRMIIPSFASLSWGEPNRQECLLFLKGLRNICREYHALCFISVDSSLLEPTLFQEASLYADCVLEFTSFSGEKRETPAEFSEFHGLLKILRLPCLHSYVPHLPESLAYGCKVRRKRMTLEKLHPPPEGDSNDPPSRSSRAQTSSALQSSGMGCSSTGGYGAKSNLDF